MKLFSLVMGCLMFCSSINADSFEESYAKKSEENAMPKKRTKDEKYQELKKKCEEYRRQKDEEKDKRVEVEKKLIAAHMTHYRMGNVIAITFGSVITIVSCVTIYSITKFGNK